MAGKIFVLDDKKVWIRADFFVPQLFVKSYSSRARSTVSKETDYFLVSRKLEVIGHFIL